MDTFAGKPQLVTASWFTQLPEGTARIGISRGPPRGQRGYRMLRCLAPGPWFKSVGDNEFFELYLSQLGRLDPDAVYRQIADLAEGADRASLVCFEKPGEGRWCHRALTGRWLSEGLGVPVPEFGFEDRSPLDHPLLPPSTR